MIRYVEETFGSQVIQEWVDMKTYEEEFTACHLAAFRGNLSVLKTLISAGANFSLKNKTGLTLVHLAA